MKFVLKMMNSIQTSRLQSELGWGQAVEDACEYPHLRDLAYLSKQGQFKLLSISEMSAEMAEMAADQVLGKDISTFHQFQRACKCNAATLLGLRLRLRTQVTREVSERLLVCLVCVFPGEDIIDENDRAVVSVIRDASRSLMKVHNAKVDGSASPLVCVQPMKSITVSTKSTTGPYHIMLTFEIQEEVLILYQIIMNIVFKMMNFVLKMMNFAFKKMNFVSKMHESSSSLSTE